MSNDLVAFCLKNLICKKKYGFQNMGISFVISVQRMFEEGQQERKQ